jgi:ABC-2 type transport system permease protein
MEEKAMIYGMFRFELKKNLKDKGLLFWALILPILFIVLFGYIFAGNTTDVTFTIPYLDEDQSELSGQFVSSLEYSSTFELQEYADHNQALAELDSGDIDSFVWIPEGFAEQIVSGGDNPVYFYYNTLHEDSVAPIRTLLDNISYTFQEEKLSQALAANGVDVEMLLVPAVDIVAEAHVGEGVEPITHIVPGYTVMFTFFIMISMVFSFVKDLESGMVARMASTPLSTYEYLIGKWLPYILIVLAQIFALLTFGKLVYGLELGNIGALLLVSVALAVITTGWGLAISLLTKSENMGIAITQIIALGGAMLGGIWVPLELLPEFMQTISRFLPQYWAQQGFLEAMIYGGGIADVALNALILVLYGMAGLVAAAFGYRRFLAAARG